MHSIGSVGIHFELRFDWLKICRSVFWPFLYTKEGYCVIFMSRPFMPVYISVRSITLSMHVIREYSPETSYWREYGYFITFVTFVHKFLPSPQGYVSTGKLWPWITPHGAMILTPDFHMSVRHAWPRLLTSESNCRKCLFYLTRRPLDPSFISWYPARHDQG